MTVYVRDTEYPIAANINLYTATMGFYLRGEEIKHYQKQDEIAQFIKGDVLLDYVAETQHFLSVLGINVPKIEYPVALQPYIGRHLRQANFSTISNHPENWHVFIKPAEMTKSFTGRVVKDAHDLRGISLALTDKIWISDIVNFTAEWRAFIINGNVIDVRPYSGDYHQTFDAQLLDQAVQAWEDAPSAYSLDIGVTSSGRTLVVEANDGYSVGCYGLNPYQYAIFLQTRWQELVKPHFMK